MEREKVLEAGKDDKGLILKLGRQNLGGVAQSAGLRQDLELATASAYLPSKR